jgi:hypothetical protein
LFNWFTYADLAKWADIPEVTIAYTWIRRDLKIRPNNGFLNASEIALIYVGLDEKDQAMMWLEKTYGKRFNPSVLLRPCFDPLRSNPRFQDLLHRIGLNR